MTRKTFATLTALIILSLISPFTQAAQPPPPPTLNPETGPTAPGDPIKETPVQISKLAPELRNLAQNGSREPLPVIIEVKAGTDLSGYLADYVARPFVSRGNQLVYGTAHADDLFTLAAMENVVAIASNELRPDQMTAPGSPEADAAIDEATRQARLKAIRAVDIPFAETASARRNARDWFDVGQGHASNAAWDKGFTGDGVVVGIIDDGVDFGHPDLLGTAARVTDPGSPYYGWPMAFSEVSMMYYTLDTIYGYSYIHDGAYGAWYADTSVTRTVSATLSGTAVITYTPLKAYNSWSTEHAYTISATSKSDVAHVGSFPDIDLQELYGERVAVLVMDEAVAGVYDTVYVDLDNDYDFTDEKPARKWDEYIYRDMDGDGYADLSGGMIYWISDGQHHPPVYDWLWDPYELDPAPNVGNLIMFSGAYDLGYSHGTNCASNVAGQGVVNGGLSAQPFRTGGMVQGAAPDAKLMNFGNFYRTPEGPRQEDIYRVVTRGYDGVVDSGDKVQIAVNPYGSTEAYFDNWHYYDRYIAQLNHTEGAHTAFVFSYGDQGAGYSTHEGEGGVTAIKVGSATQFGSTNWDSIASADQIVHGDVSARASHGPDFDGHLAPDVLASGTGAGSEKINYFGLDGETAWSTWESTDRSAAVASGNLALIYQAYRARHGVWPTYQQAKDFLVAGATDANADPSLQGGGVVNADRSTDLAAGMYGAYATPTRWSAGDYRGTDYPSFAHLVDPGETVSQTFTLHNPSGYAIGIHLSDGKLAQIGDAVEIHWRSADLGQESDFNFYTPDYLIPITPTLIPADTQLMVVRFVQPLAQYDPDGDYATENHWRHLLYNWTDLNGDGKLWVDADANGVVNHQDITATLDNDGFYRPDFANSEIQAGEYIRFDYNWGGNTDQLTLRDPLQRMGDGLFIGLQHERATAELPVSDLTIYVEFYERVDWPWLSLSDTLLTVPPWGSETFEATLAVPADAAYGFYDGAILLQDPGDDRHDPHLTVLPVGVDVAAELGDLGLSFGGDGATDQMYDNQVVRGLGRWQGENPSIYGDWRHFFVDVPTTTRQTNAYLVAHSDWEGTPPSEGWALGTDVDTYILGPEDDDFAPQWDGTPDPVFGPYGLALKGTSRLDDRGGGLWGFGTWTDDTRDWAIVPLEDTGLYEIGLHNGLFDSNTPEVAFELDVGRLDLGATVMPSGTVDLEALEAEVYTTTGQIHLWFTPTLELPGLNADLSGGLIDTTYGPFNEWITDTNQCFGPWCPGNVYKYFDVTTGTTRIDLNLYVYGWDGDLYLLYDTNGNGIAEQAHDNSLGSSGNGSGIDERIVLNNPEPGGYFAVLSGYDVGGGAYLDWLYILTAPGPPPTAPLVLYDGSVLIGQDDPLDPTTASFSTTVTTTERVAALKATLTDVPSGSNVDLYATNVTGTVVASSTHASNASEAITLTPPLLQYRFAAGEPYTIWVHGYDVPTPTVTPTLHLEWEQLKLWLSSTHPDVHARAINPGEAVSVTLNYDDATMVPDTDCINARPVIGPDEFVIFGDLFDVCYVSAPVPGPAAAFRKSFVAERGPSPFLYNGFPTALANISDTVTFTLKIANTGVTTGTYYAEDWILPNWEHFESFVVTPTNYGWTTSNPWKILWFTDTLGVGEEVEVVYKVSVDSPYSDPMGYIVPNYLNVYDDNSGNYYGGDTNYIYFRSFRITGSKKSLDPSAILAGDTFTYNIHLENSSSEDKVVYLSDPLSDKIDFVSATAGMVYHPLTHTVTWSGLLPGTSLSATDMDIVVQAKPDLAYSTVITNRAALAETPGGAPFAYLEADTSVGTGAALQITKTANAINGFVKDTLNYTVTFRNAGIETAQGVVMRDSTSLYLNIVGDTVTATRPSAGDLYQDGLVRWQGDLTPGERVTMTFQATITPSALPGLALINMAAITATNYPTPTYDSTLTELFGQPDLALSPRTGIQSGKPGQTVTHTLRLTNTGFVQGVFELSHAGDAPTWPVYLPTTVYTLPAEIGTDVAVHVTVAPDALAGASSAASVTATLRQDEAISASVTLTTTAAAAYGVTLTPEVAERSGDPGEAVTHTLRLTNTGNTSVTFTFAYTSTGSDWGVTLPPDTLLKAYAAQDVAVALHIPADAHFDESNTAFVSVSFQGSAGLPGATSRLTTSVSAQYGVLLAPSGSAGAGAPGEAVTYTLRVTNTGNADDSFTVAAGATWTVTASTTVGPLVAGTGQDLPVVVSIPASASDGDQDTATVTVNSQGAPALGASSTLTTTAMMTDVCQPVVAPYFAFEATKALMGDVVTFSGSVTSGDPPISYTWNWGDGSATQTGNPITHVFPVTSTPQTYTVTLTADNVCHNPQTVERSVTVQLHRLYLPVVMRNY